MLFRFQIFVAINGQQIKDWQNSLNKLLIVDYFLLLLPNVNQEIISFSKQLETKQGTQMNYFCLQVHFCGKISPHLELVYNIISTSTSHFS